MSIFPGEIISTTQTSNDAILKQCIECNQWKTVESYHKKKRGKLGVNTRCIICNRTYSRSRSKLEYVIAREAARHRENYSDPAYRARLQARMLQNYSTISGRAKVLLRTARRSLASRTTPCTVTLDHIIKGIEAEFCPVTGIRFELGNEHRVTNARKANPYSPSLDRTDARKGYTNENTRVVIWQYNMAKGETTDAEMLKLCRAVVERNA